MVARQRLGEGPEKATEKRLQRVERAAPLGYSSITRGGMRIASAEGLTIQGTARTTGTQNIDGTLNGSGSFDWTGPSWMRGAFAIQGSASVSGPLTVSSSATFSGNTSIGGTCTIAGTLNVNGAATLNSTLTVGSGQIRAGDVTITPSGGGSVQVGGLQIDGASGGTIRSGGTIYLDGGSPSVRVTGRLSTDGLLVLGKITAAELNVTGAKNFQMPHPTQPGMWLRHGSTESPVSGIEYWGDDVLDDDGQCVVELPEYFEALAKPEHRSVLVTGRGHSPDWSDIDDGSFTVTGKPGGRFSWLVKAERFGGDFLLEEAIPEDEEEAS